MTDGASDDDSRVRVVRRRFELRQKEFGEEEVSKAVGRKVKFDPLSREGVARRLHDAGVVLSREPRDAHQLLELRSGKAGHVQRGRRRDPLAS